MKPTRTYTVDEATRKLEHYCAYQERCHQEVTRKLRSMQMIPMAIDHIIGHLIQHNYLNEERFARSFARGKFRQKYWGRNRIERELKAREVSKYNIKAAMQELPQEEYTQHLYILAQKKLQQIRETHPMKKRKKLADYLLYRGWETHLVYDTVKDLIP